MKCRCSNCGWLEVNPGGAMFCGYSDQRTWENESCLAWKDKDEPKTNADKLRAMSDEELAVYIDEHTAEAMWCNNPPFDCPPEEKCVDCILDWLRQEAK